MPSAVAFTGLTWTKTGYAIDDAIIGKVSDTEYMIVVNAGMGGAIAKHMETVKGDRQVDIADLTDRLGKFDIQGPLSVKIMQKVLKDPDKVFDKMVYFTFKGHFDPASPLAHQVQLKDGTPLLLSRSGYTGEVGFEVFIAPEDTVKAWETIMAAGLEFGCLPCGLASRDSLRTGSLLPLSHQDIGHWTYLNHPGVLHFPMRMTAALQKSLSGPKPLSRPGIPLSTPSPLSATICARLMPMTPGYWMPMATTSERS